LQQLSKMGAELLAVTLDNLEQGTVTPLAQRDMAGSRAPKLKKEEAFIDWNLPAVTLFNKIRAFKPFPGTVTLFRGKRLGIEWAEVVLDDGPQQFRPGVLRRIGNDFFDVETGNGILRVVSVKPEGKRSMSVKDFLNGTTCKEGYCFNE
jgi:methionyl-tRNA formyltransferase